MIYGLVSRPYPPIATGPIDESAVIAQAKLFAPWNTWTCYVAQVGLERRQFLGVLVWQKRDVGIFSLAMLEQIRGPAGESIQYLPFWEPRPLADCY